MRKFAFSPIILLLLTAALGLSTSACTSSGTKACQSVAATSAANRICLYEDARVKLDGLRASAKRLLDTAKVERAEGRIDDDTLGDIARIVVKFTDANDKALTALATAVRLNDFSRDPILITAEALSIFAELWTTYGSGSTHAGPGPAHAGPGGVS